MTTTTGGGETAPNECLEEAIHDLEKAQDHRAHARADEVNADREIADAIEKVKAAEHDHDRVTVHVIHVNEVEKASFEAHLSTTLAKVWDRSYEALKIERKPKDIFQTAGDPPKSLMSHLGLTLEEAHKRNVITDNCFGIVSETGGA